ncbi:hypothetical protein KIN20_027047 [Parelaphostrongylus tenuis]|uniref:Uncharacterized protein n=1 Tax=Parelaphostrongylus tenuis TaxID=148309 RepID=A0AAD5WDN3_PARTN|nr:hypothetical protein KIN20_027047 [Parelaphostrongylus tenuis]
MFENDHPASTPVPSGLSDTLAAVLILRKGNNVRKCGVAFKAFKGERGAKFTIGTHTIERMDVTTSRQHLKSPKMA